MDEGIDFGVDYGSGDLIEPISDSNNGIEAEWGDEFVEANELIDIEPEGIDDTFLGENDVDDLLDQNQIEEYSPELEENAEICDKPEEISSSENLSKWIGEINPNYDEFDLESPYSNNCGSCAYAVYQRLEGKPDSTADVGIIPYNTDMEALTGMEQVSMSPGEIEKTLLDEGEGAHAIIGIDRSEGPGHWFNAVNVDGMVKAVDGQTGEITDWPPDYEDVVNWEMSVKKETLNE